MEIPPLIFHTYSVCDAFECWRRAANEDVERGWTFSLFIPAITRTYQKQNEVRMSFKKYFKK